MATSALAWAAGDGGRVVGWNEGARGKAEAEDEARPDAAASGGWEGVCGGKEYWLMCWDCELGPGAGGATVGLARGLKRIEARRDVDEVEGLSELARMDAAREEAECRSLVMAFMVLLRLLFGLKFGSSSTGMTMHPVA